MYAIQGVEQDGRAGVAQLHVGEDIHHLHELVEDVGDVRLVIVDPIMAYIGADTDAHRDNSVRDVLAPLADFAARHGVAVVAVTHLRKSSSDTSLYRILGSVAFTAIARSVWMVGKIPGGDDTERGMACSKMNLARPGRTLGFSVIDPGRIEWSLMPLDLTADEMFAASESGHPDESGPAVMDAMEFLQDALADGARKAKDIKRDARENSIADRTLTRAKSKLGVKSERTSFQGVYYWRLPDHPAGTGRAPE
ncbi:MAG: AAA family ATPase [Planctomycetes bacterium]|nr:AAA family ATPase [Planctomycetota bacterium]